MSVRWARHEAERETLKMPKTMTDHITPPDSSSSSEALTQARDANPGTFASMLKGLPTLLVLLLWEAV